MATRKPVGNVHTIRLDTDQEIDDCLRCGEPRAVIGLNGRNLVQFQLPPGNDYIVFSPAQARETALLLCKHADRSEAALSKTNPPRRPRR